MCAHSTWTMMQMSTTVHHVLKRVYREKTKNIERDTKQTKLTESSYRWSKTVFVYIPNSIRIFFIFESDHTHARHQSINLERHFVVCFSFSGHVCTIEKFSTHFKPKIKWIIATNITSWLNNGIQKKKTNRDWVGIALIVDFFLSLTWKTCAHRFHKMCSFLLDLDNNLLLCIQFIWTARVCVCASSIRLIENAVTSYWMYSFIRHVQCTPKKSDIIDSNQHKYYLPLSERVSRLKIEFQKNVFS